jgi:hypothetical protein
MANVKLAAKTAGVAAGQPAGQTPAGQAPGGHAAAPGKAVAGPAPMDAMAAAAAQVQELKVTGHMMALPAGLFSIVNEPNTGGKQDGGMPGVRISPPPVNGEDVEIVGFRADGWLNADGDGVLVRVRKPGHVLVTIYQLPNTPDAAPKIQVRQLMAGSGVPAADASGSLSTPATPDRKPERADLIAHIQSRGDVGVKFGIWLGEPGSGNWIEGFAIAAPEGIAVEDLSYQAVLGRGWLSPWVDAGEYCGSRGMALPLLGLRVRLTGAAAEQYEISCEASFVGGATAGPVGNDETCEAEELAPLEALLVTLTPLAASVSRRPARGKR